MAFLLNTTSTLMSLVLPGRLPNRSSIDVSARGWLREVVASPAVGGLKHGTGPHAVVTTRHCSRLADALVAVADVPVLPSTVAGSSAWRTMCMDVYAELNQVRIVSIGRDVSLTRA